MAKEETALEKIENKNLAIDDKATSLATDFGKTVISDSVVAKIASIATREIKGVHSLSARGMSDTLMGLAKKVTGTDTRGQGVDVEVGTKEAAVDVSIVVNYGVSIPQIAEAVRENVIETVKLMTGLIVKEVNIAVTDLYFPEDDDKEEEKARRVE
jgi:uncharacterized alkaline shock family protein YloU